MHIYIPTHSDTALRLMAATAVGALIGLNREMRGKPAGLRTHSLVTLGAALMTLCGVYLSVGEDANATSRVLQGIITGIGFLGVGVIIRDNAGHVRGLTTAATIWMAAALGIVCGIGYWWAAI